MNAEVISFACSLFSCQLRKYGILLCLNVVSPVLYKCCIVSDAFLILFTIRLVLRFYEWDCDVKLELHFLGCVYLLLV